MFAADFPLFLYVFFHCWLDAASIENPLACRQRGGEERGIPNSEE
jgi:hypothetical protein